jgi:hypothetical protein
MVPITDPKRLLEAEATAPASALQPGGKIKLNFSRISKNSVEKMARQSLYVHRARTPEGFEMPDPVEKIGTWPMPRTRGPVTT